jgi:hypothetical protein
MGADDADREEATEVQGEQPSQPALHPSNGPVAAAQGAVSTSEPPCDGLLHQPSRQQP